MREDESGFESDVSVGNTLIDMYGKWGSLEDARKIFDCLPQEDVITWSAMIEVWFNNGYDNDALQLFEQMQYTSTEPD